MAVQNNVTLIGNLTTDLDAVIVQTKKGDEMFVGTVTIAVNDRDRADFIRIKLLGNRWEKVADYLTKGRAVAINGHIQTGSFEDNKGERHFTTDVIVDSLQLLGGSHKEETKDEPKQKAKKWNKR